MRGSTHGNMTLLLHKLARKSPRKPLNPQAMASQYPGYGRRKAGFRNLESERNILIYLSICATQQDHFDTTIALAALRSRIRCQRLLTTQSDGSDLIGRDPGSTQHVLDRIGALLRQVQVGLRVALAVGVAFDPDHRARAGLHERQ